MKLVNNLIDKYGVDKILHFLVGALLTAVASIIGHVFWGFTGFLVGSFVMIPVVYVISYIKEKWLDESYDALDIKAAMLGTGIITIANVLMFWLFAVMNDM